MAGKRWGKKSKIVWLCSISRNAILLVILTTISFLVNRNRKPPVFNVSNISATSIKAPVVPPASLISKVAGPAIPAFLAASLEHLAIAKSFGRRNRYFIDESQELCFLGISNFANGFFQRCPLVSIVFRHRP